MTTRIRRLPQGVVDRIAAGEVVERPASVVKELVENALDAGATRIEVEIQGGGRDRIVVKDDGCGMGAADLELAFASHATSKLTEVSDLDHIASFGFRGEALASIGAVADCRIVSREHDADEGYEIESRGGRVEGVRVAAASPGTLLDVRNLFKYVPARRKFLRAASTEMSHISSALHRLALANPGVGFGFTRDGRKVFRVAPEDGRRARLARFFGRDLAEALVPVEGGDGSLSLTGMVAPPESARRTASGYHFFLNGRFVRDRALVNAVRHAYEGLLTTGRHPVVFLFLSMDPALVDVNVHPAKLEVRFHDGQRVHRLVRRSVRDALLEADLSPNPLAQVLGRAAPSVPAGAGEVREQYFEGVKDALEGFLTSPRGQRPPVEASPDSRPLSLPRPAPSARPVARYLQVADLFLVFETEDGGVAIADQHALHERILLEEIKGRVLRGRLEVQRLLVPTVVELPASDVDLVLGEAESLARLGLEVDRFGDTAIALHTLPAMLARKDPARILAGVLDRLREGRGAGGKDGLLETLMHSMACRSAIMAGDPLTEEQAAELMRRAGAIDTAQSCAHGRPTILKLPFKDLTRHFGRDGG